MAEATEGQDQDWVTNYLSQPGEKTVIVARARGPSVKMATQFLIGTEAAMSLQIRRVVTGHTADGRAKVEVDEIAKNVISNRPGASSCVVWSTKGFPVDNDGFHDPASGSFNTTVEGGTLFRIVRYRPGVAPQSPRCLDRLCRRHVWSD